jgi:hypothetical protein
MTKTLAVALTAVVGCMAIVYMVTGGPIHVVDGFDVTVLDTSLHPVEGVVVAARWQSSSFFCIHGDCYLRTIRTDEAVTDSNGHATVRRAVRRREGFELVTPNEPRIVVYKAGYNEGEPDSTFYLSRSWIDDALWMFSKQRTRRTYFISQTGPAMTKGWSENVAAKLESTGPFPRMEREIRSAAAIGSTPAPKH